MDLTLNYDASRLIPVPFERRTSEGHAAWARRAASDFVQASGLHGDVVPRIEAALVPLTSEAGDDRSVLLVVGLDGGVVAPFVIAASPYEMPRQEQADLLWSNTAILPATPRLTETDGFGVGFSSTLAQRADGYDFATRRWIFFGEGMTVCAMLGPVVPYGMAFVEPFAESALVTSSIEGFVPKSDRTRVDELVSAVVRPGDDWDL